MNRKEVIEFVLGNAGLQRDRDDIILALCEKLDVDWQKADALVRDIETRYRYQLALRQSPLLLILGGIASLLGVGLVSYAAYIAIFILDYSAGWLGFDWATAYNTFTLLGIGVAILGGVIWGLSSLFTDLLDK